jgi:hypothetical protein
VYYLNARHLLKHEHVNFGTFWNYKLGIVKNKGTCTYVHLVLTKLDETTWKRIRMYLFIAWHELAICIVDNNVEVQIAHKGTQLFYKFNFFCTI